MAALKVCARWWLIKNCYRKIKTVSKKSIPLTTQWNLHYHHCCAVKHRSGITELPVAVQFRSFFNMRVIGSKKKEYAGRKLVGYSMEQMYTVVAEVEKYTEFVPFCKKSVVWSRGPEHMKADLMISFPPIYESYTSNITIHKPYLVKAVCTEGQLFNYLLTEWKFSPGLKGNPQSCITDFTVTFEFRSLLHSHLAHVFFNEVVRQMEDAFIREATNRFGKASVKTQQLVTVPISS